MNSIANVPSFSTVAFHLKTNLPAPLKTSVFRSFIRNRRRGIFKMIFRLSSYVEINFHEIFAD